MFEKNSKKIKELWSIRNLTVRDCLENFSQREVLKSLLTFAGIGWVAFQVMGGLMLIHIIIFVVRLFKIVLG